MAMEEENVLYCENTIYKGKGSYIFDTGTLRHLERLHLQHNLSKCLLYFSDSITEIILPPHDLSFYLPEDGQKWPKHVACNIVQ